MAKAKKAYGQKTPYMVRIDTEVLDGLRKLADGAEVSVSQIVNGLLRWAVDNAHLGEPHWEDTGNPAQGGPQDEMLTATHPAPGCLWFGEIADEQYLEEHRYDPRQIVAVHCRLDFTERRVVRED